MVCIHDGTAKAIKREFPNIIRIEMEGCGQDTFGEDVMSFLMTLKNTLDGEYK